MKMKTTIVLHDVYCDVTYPEYLHVCNLYYKNLTSFIVTVCVFVRHLFSWYPFYFNFHSARIIFDVSSGFYLWNINNTKADQVYF